MEDMQRCNHPVSSKLAKGLGKGAESILRRPRVRNLANLMIDSAWTMSNPVGQIHSFINIITLPCCPYWWQPLCREAPL